MERRQTPSTNVRDKKRNKCNSFNYSTNTCFQLTKLYQYYFKELQWCMLSLGWIEVRVRIQVVVVLAIVVLAVEQSVLQYNNVTIYTSSTATPFYTTPYCTQLVYICTVVTTKFLALFPRGCGALVASIWSHDRTMGPNGFNSSTNTCFQLTKLYQY